MTKFNKFNMWVCVIDVILMLVAFYWSQYPEDVWERAIRTCLLPMIISVIAILSLPIMLCNPYWRKS